MPPAVTLRRRRQAARISAAAFVWCLGLILAALLIPVYDQTEATSSGPTATTVTLVQGHGLWVLIPISIPALTSAVVLVALRRRCSRGDPLSGRIAWIGTGVLAAFALFSILSIGVFVIPVVFLLAWATAVARPARGPRLRAQRGE